jgi:hypothetical protein
MEHIYVMGPLGFGAGDNRPSCLPLRTKHRSFLLSSLELLVGANSLYIHTFNSLSDHLLVCGFKSSRLMLMDPNKFLELQKPRANVKSHFGTFLIIEFKYAT